MSNAIYEGYHREWRLDPLWRYGTKYTKCRQPRCPNLPVAEMDRYARRPNGMDVYKRPYAYCANHLYGRKIENGQVMHNILVKDSDA